MAHFEDEVMRSTALELNKRGYFPFAYNIADLFDKRRPQIRGVISNPPATIIFWRDGSKTVVKCSEGDEYDIEKGIAFGMLKKIYGSDYYKTINKTVRGYKDGTATKYSKKRN